MKQLLMLLLVFGFSFAASITSINVTVSDPSPPPSPPPIDFGPIISALTNLPNQIVSAFFSYVVDGLSSIISTLRDSAIKFMFSSPNINWFCAPFNGVMAILTSLYALVLMGLALFLILRSGDVEGRIEAKKWTENMLVMIVVLSFSFQLFGMLLEFNTYLSNSLANSSMGSIFGAPTNPSNMVFAFVILILGVTFGMTTYLTLLLRYLLIPVMLLLFPVAIFMYFIPSIKSWGKTFLKIILVFVFIPTADAMVMVGLSAMFGSNDPNLTDSLVRSLAVIFSFAFLGFVNIALLLIAILSVLDQSGALGVVAGFTMLKGIVRRK